MKINNLMCFFIPLDVVVVVIFLLIHEEKYFLWFFFSSEIFHQISIPFYPRNYIKLNFTSKYDFLME